MFDIGFLELLVVGVLALLVLGPERLPGAIRTTSLWLSKLKRSFQQIKLEIEREIDVQELKQQLHNDSIMDTLKQTKSDIENNIQGARDSLSKQLGDNSYDVSDIFVQHNDTLPDHEPLPDPYDLEDTEPQPRQEPPADTHKS